MTHGDILEIVYDGSVGDPTIISYDTGGTTGWAVISVHPDALLEPDVLILDNITHFAFGEITGTEYEQVDRMAELADDWPGAALVLEDFIVRRFDMSRAALAPVRLNAAFRYIMSPGRYVNLQQPQLAKTTITDERLRRIGYWERTSAMPHARDSIRHGFTFLKRLKTQPKLLKETFPALFE